MTIILSLVIIVLLLFRLAKNRVKRKVEGEFIANESAIHDDKSKDEIIYQTIQGYQSQIQEFLSSENYIPHSELERFMLRMDPSYDKVVVLERYLKRGTLVHSLAKSFISKYRTLSQLCKAHNREFVARELETQSDYFDGVLEYPLDLQQRTAVVTLEDNCLVVSSAGSGKTSTMCGKVKYLVEKQGIDPKKILLITYTRKASESLTARLAIPELRCYTFHKLALDIIAKSTGSKPSICSDSIFISVFESLYKEYYFQKAVNRYLASYQANTKDDFEYDDAQSYIADRKKYGIQAPYPDMDGRTIYTKSEQEKKICTFLSELGVRFRYEKPYEYKLSDTLHRQYMPDFTIYYTTEEGVERHLYLEHFGIDANGNVAKWMGDGEEGGWEAANKRYNEGVEWKKEIHTKYQTDLLFTTSADFSNFTIYNKLRAELQQRGVKFKPLTEDEKSKYLLGNSNRKERALTEMLASFILLMKGKCKKMEDVVAQLPAVAVLPADKRNKFIISSLVVPFYDRYMQMLAARGEIDFTDAILWATQLCENGDVVDYDYILVDEFQDISLDRYRFLKAMRHKCLPTTKLFCVGDDWQSIYRFSGSDLTLFTHFESYFGYTAECNIETTYRFGNPSLQLTSDFIKKNPLQKVKFPKPFSKDVATGYEFVEYVCEDGKEGKFYYLTLKTIIDSIPADKSVLFVGRYTMDVEILRSYFECDIVGDKVVVNYGSRKIPFMTAHQSKGLEADYVILLRCNSGNYGFPTMITDDPILSFVLSEDDKFAFGEERRVFYVAMTRAKIKTFVLYDAEHPSCFVDELMVDLQRHTDSGANLCPKCKCGEKKKIKSGVAKSGFRYSSYVCSNQGFGCDYFYTEFYQ